MNNLEHDYMKYAMNPPLVVGEALGVIMTGAEFQGGVMKIKPDNRYKDGNIQIVNGVIRGNERTVKVKRLGDD